MLVTFERVWAVGRFHVGRIRRLFVVQHNHHKLEQLPTGDVCEPFRGTPNRNVPKRGKIVPKRGTIPTLSKDGGVYPHASIPKSGTATPHF